MTMLKGLAIGVWSGCLIIGTLLDTGLRVSELAGLTREHIDWQNHRLMIDGKGGLYGTKSKRRILPLTDRIRPLIDGHFAIHMC
jgi:integrase/recombinase XerD